MLDEVVAVIAEKQNKAKRIGAKRMKAMEKPERVGDKLNASESTMFRALAARANCLARDQPGCAFSTKELCR